MVYTVCYIARGTEAEYVSEGTGELERDVASQ